MIRTKVASVFWIALTAAVLLNGVQTSAQSAAASAGASAALTQPAKRFIIVFNFQGAGQLGVQLADSIRVRLAGLKDKELEIIDRLSAEEVTPAGGVGADLAQDKLADLLKTKAAAQVGIVGAVTKSGSEVKADVAVLDLSGKSPIYWRQTFSDSTERARGEIARQVVELLLKKSSWRPPEYGDEPEPKDFAAPLNLNGNFEGSTGWQKADNVTSFIVNDPRKDALGKVLRIFTDVDREKWLEYQQQLRLGQADPASAPKIGTVANKYETVAGLEGVHFRSEWIAAKPGQRYWLMADMKGKTDDFFFPKIFVKGFADFSGQPDAISDVSLNELKMSADQFAKLLPDKQKELIAADAKAHPDRYRREVYRWYLSCRDFDNTWKHFAAPFPPRGGLPANVQYLRIEVYAYWPPGEYLFDNVNLYADTAQKAPLSEEPSRTEHYKPTLTQPAGK